MAFEEDEQYSSLLTRVQKICKIAYLILRIVFYVVVALSIFVLLAFFVLSFFFVPESGVMSFDLLSFVQLVLSTILSLALIRFAILIMRDVVRGTSPFTQKQSKRIRYMSYILFAQVLFELASAVIVPALYISGQLIMSVHSTTAAGSEPTLYINLQALVFAVILFCLSLVFEYGSLLQRDKDEFI